MWSEPGASAGSSPAVGSRPPRHGRSDLAVASRQFPPQPNQCRTTPSAPARRSVRLAPSNVSSDPSSARLPNRRDHGGSLHPFGSGIPSSPRPCPPHYRAAFACSAAPLPPPPSPSLRLGYRRLAATGRVGLTLLSNGEMRMGRLRPIVRRVSVPPSSMMAVDEPTRVPFWPRPIRWDFLPANKSQMTGRGTLPRLAVPGTSRPHKHSTVLAPSRTLRAGAPRRRSAPGPLRGLLDRACARRSADWQVGTEGCRLQSNRRMVLESCLRWLAVVGVEQDLLPQQNAGDPEQPVGDAAQGAAIGVAPHAQGLVAAATLRVVHGGDTGPVEHRLAQSILGGIAHNDGATLAAALGHWRHPGEGAEGGVV